MQEYLERYSVEQQKLMLEQMKTYEPLLRPAIKRIDLHLNCITISYDIDYIIKYFATMAFNAEFKYTKDNEQLITNQIAVQISLTPQRQNKIIIPGKANYDIKLIQAIVKSFWYNKLGADDCRQMLATEITNALEN